MVLSPSHITDTDCPTCESVVIEGTINPEGRRPGFELKVEEGRHVHGKDGQYHRLPFPTIGVDRLGETDEPISSLVHWSIYERPRTMIHYVYTRV